MTESDRLKSKLGKLAGEDARATSEGRRIAEAGGDLRAALIDEIDETILGRELRFTNGSGATLVLEVSGRRLLRVAGAPGAGADLTAPIGEEAEALLAGIAACLSAFLAEGGPLHVTTAPLGRRPDPANVGRAAEAIGQLLDMAGEAPGTAPAPAPEPEGDFDEALEGLDWLRFDAEGKEAAEGGEAGALAGLTPETRAALDAQLGSETEAPRALVLYAGEEPALLYGREPGGAIAVRAPAEAMPRLLALWQRGRGA